MRLIRVTYLAHAQESAARPRPSRPASRHLQRMHTVRQEEMRLTRLLAEIIDLAVVASPAVLDDVAPLRDVLLPQRQALIMTITDTTNNTCRLSNSVKLICILPTAT